MVALACILLFSLRSLETRVSDLFLPHLFSIDNCVQKLGNYSSIELGDFCRDMLACNAAAVCVLGPLK